MKIKSGILDKWKGKRIRIGLKKFEDWQYAILVDYDKFGILVRDAEDWLDDGFYIWDDINSVNLLKEDDSK